MSLDRLDVDLYAIVPTGLPEDLLAPARAAIAELAPATPEWGVVPVHHHPTFWAIRQRPELVAIFAALHGTDDLWVSMDRAICKPPHAPDASRLHRDVDPRRPGRAFQGMLFLTDAPVGQGAFQCVPSLPAFSGDLEAPIDVTGHAVVDVPARAGDLLIWDARLPHHGGPNTGVAPRISLAVMMNPAGSDAERAERIAWFEARRAPPWWRGWPGQLDPEPWPLAALTPLGRRLVGFRD